LYLPKPYAPCAGIKFPVDVFIVVYYDKVSRVVEFFVFRLAFALDVVDKGVMCVMSLLSTSALTKPAALFK